MIPWCKCKWHPSISQFSTLDLSWALFHWPPGRFPLVNLAQSDISFGSNPVQSSKVVSHQLNKNLLLLKHQSWQDFKSLPNCISQDQNEQPQIECQIPLSKPFFLRGGLAAVKQKMALVELSRNLLPRKSRHHDLQDQISAKVVPIRHGGIDGQIRVELGYPHTNFDRWPGHNKDQKSTPIGTGTWKGITAPISKKKGEDHPDHSFMVPGWWILRQS